MENLNRLVLDMARNKKLSRIKIDALISLKEFIDRISGSTFTPEEEVKKLEAKFGVKPDIITWGDYYQVNVATANWEKSDEAFLDICDEFRFELIHSTSLFYEITDEEIISTVRADQTEAQQKDSSERSARDGESIYIGNLLTYFENMQLRGDLISQDDIQFFLDYRRVEKVS